MLGYERGSEWRRWDLHMHTPGTQKNDQYSGTCLEDKWNQFYQTIADYIGDGSDPMKSVAVIGITDYLSVDNCKKVMHDRRLPDTVQLVLPNVEMRMAPIARQTPINIHCIFSPELIDELETRFFSKLFFDFGGTNYSASHDDLRRLGRSFAGESLSDEEAYSIGLEQFVITPQAIESVFKGDSALREKTIIVVSNKSADGVSGVTQHQGYSTENGSQMDATRRSIYRMADLIFSSSNSDIRYFLGESADSSEVIKERYGSLKGCIHGSDAHANAMVFEPDQQRYCWVKSDPTFNGLKQIVYEPKARIRISPVKPEEKPAYQVIESVTFSNPDFSTEPIVFNDKLTCIIGGKSTGKSLLLHNMAMAIDSSQVQEKVGVTKAGSRIVPEIQVKWADGTVSCPGGASDDHKIVYVPQTYLNRLTDENEERTEIDVIIHEIIMINTAAATAYRTMNTGLGNYKLELDKKIYDCTQKYNGLQVKKAALKDIGTLKGIQEEIAKLKKKKEELSKETSITAEEIAQYDAAIAEVTRLNALISTVDREILTISGMDDIFREIEIPTDLSEETSSAISAALLSIKQQANEQWRLQRAQIIGDLEKKKADYDGLRVKSKEIADKIAPKIADNEAVRKLSEQIAAEEEKLIKFNDTAKQVEQLQQQYQQAADEIVKAFTEFKRIRELYAREINGNQDISQDGLSFSVVTPFRTESFCGLLSSLFDGRAIKSQKAWLDLDVLNEAWLENIDNLKRLINKVMDGDLRITKGKTAENALREIFSDWYNSTYQVVMDGDVIGNMSPGKKALVLLKLLINLAESTCPILIDQPEDDLDNRSIFDELIPFIRRKKVDRQIIIVTHNANVVLGGDAEEVIVANQHGNNAPNSHFKFEYRSGSIEDDEPVSADASDTLGRQGIQQHICDILEGGEKAFDLRKNKYRI